MGWSESKNTDVLRMPAEFNTTQWTMVMLAGQSQAPQAGEALQNLCCTYWRPIYAYVRRKGHRPHDAQDLTQEFFARLLEKKYLKLASQERGRFRSFLLKSLQHFLINEWERGQAVKRGGGLTMLSLDHEAAEQGYLQSAADEQIPESFYDRRWALALLEKAMEQLGTDYTSAGKSALFKALQPMIFTEGSGDAYQRLATLLGLTEGALKVALHRLRKRLREAIRVEVARTVDNPNEVDEELRYLMAALRA